MDKKERIVLAFLFVISCIYSFVMPESSIEKIENVPEITIFIEGAVNTKLSYDHDPTISEIFKDIHIENSYGFDEDYCLSSQDVFYIPAGEQLISLNSATKEELMTIKGIGEKKAAAIIEQRNQERFQTIEDIMKVSGIGEKTYLKIREQLCL